MILYILRGTFLLLVAAVISLFVIGDKFMEKSGYGFGMIATIIGLAIAVAIAVIASDVATKRKRLSSMSGIFVGLIAGLLLAYALSFVVDLIGIYFEPTDPEQASALTNLLRGVKVVIGLVTCYIAISMVIQTKDDFRFVIPYVEFAKDVRGNRPTLLDTSVIVDGRILDIIETRIMQGSLIVPKFVLDELQLIADSADRIKRSRGRRGLDILQKLQGSTLIEVHIEEVETAGLNVDQKLITMAQESQARVMTNDFNLNKIATLRGVDVINLNDLAKALRPVVLPGEEMNVKLVKPGESGTQGVGYLDDGTMVVVEGGREYLGEFIDVTVTSTLQTSAGRMIFSRFNRHTPSEGASQSHQAAQPAPASEGDDDEPAPATEQATHSEPRRTTSGSRRNPRR